MMQAGSISLGLALMPVVAAADEHGAPVACAFTIVCAPEIECEAHEGIPFEIGYAGGRYRVELGGHATTGLVLGLEPLTIVFANGRETLLFTLDGRDGALSRHQSGPSGLEAATLFLGPCVTA